MPRFGAALPRALAAGLRAAGVTTIVHCGDHTTALAVRLLSAIAPVEAVAGNNDGDELQQRFGRLRTLVLAGVRVGLVHGDLGRGASTPDRAAAAFAPGSVDVVCFGHSHQPLIQQRGAVLLVNPGSPTDKRREARFTYAILTLGDGAPRAEVHAYDDRSP